MADSGDDRTSGREHGSAEPLADATPDGSTSGNAEAKADCEPGGTAESGAINGTVEAAPPPTLDEDAPNPGAAPGVVSVPTTSGPPPPSANPIVQLPPLLDAPPEAEASAAAQEPGATSTRPATPSGKTSSDPAKNEAPPKEPKRGRFLIALGGLGALAVAVIAAIAGGIITPLAQRWVDAGPLSIASVQWVTDNGRPALEVRVRNGSKARKQLEHLFLGFSSLRAGPCPNCAQLDWTKYEFDGSFVPSTPTTGTLRATVSIVGSHDQPGPGRTYHAAGIVVTAANDYWTIDLEMPLSDFVEADSDFAIVVEFGDLVLPRSLGMRDPADGPPSSPTVNPLNVDPLRVGDLLASEHFFSVSVSGKGESATLKGRWSPPN